MVIEDIICRRYFLPPCIPCLNNISLQYLSIDLNLILINRRMLHSKANYL